MSRSIAVLLLMAVLAGCMGEPEPASRAPTSAECLEQGKVLDPDAPGGPACVPPPFEIRDFEDPGHHCVVTQQRDRVHAPDLVGDPWVQGQSWTYSLAVDGHDLGDTQLIYYDDQDLDNAGLPQHYMVGTPTREEALRGAVLSQNPMLGRVHRILYSPHESGDHADMFHFPLCGGSTWTTMFYGERFTLTATPATIDLPSGADAGFVIEGTSPEGSTLALSYSPAAQWFTFIHLQRAGGGSVEMDLAAMATGYSGDAFFLRGQQDETILLNGSTPAPAVAGTLAEATLAREDGGEGPYDTIGLFLQAHLAGSGAASLEIIDPSGQVAWDRSLGGQEPPWFAELVELPYEAGDWTVRLQGVAAGAGAAEVEARVDAVSIYDRSGSV